METQTNEVGGMSEGAEANATNSILNGSTAEAPAGTQNNDPASSEDNIAQTNGSTETPSGQSSVETDWRHEFAEGLEEKDKETWLNESARAENKQSMAKRFVDMRRSQSKSISLPSEDDPERESKMGEIYNKLGRPADPDEYKLNWEGDEPLTDSDKIAFDDWKQLAFRGGASQKFVDDSVKWQAQMRRVEQEAFKAKAEDIESDNAATLKSVWAGDYDKNVHAYRTSVGHYMSPADLESYSKMTLSDGSLLSNNPVMARAFAKVGLERASDDFDYTPMNADRKEGAQARLKALQNEVIEKNIRPGMPGYPAEEFNRLYQEVGSTRARSPNDQYKKRST